jgi:hypothetical protein
MNGEAMCTRKFCRVPAKAYCHTDEQGDAPTGRPQLPVRPPLPGFPARPERPTQPPRRKCSDYDESCEDCLSAGCAMTEGGGCSAMCPMDVACYQAGSRPGRDDIAKKCATRQAAMDKYQKCNDSSDCGTCQDNGVCLCLHCCC